MGSPQTELLILIRSESPATPTSLKMTCVAPTNSWANSCYSLFFLGGEAIGAQRPELCWDLKGDLKSPKKQAKKLSEWKKDLSQQYFLKASDTHASWHVLIMSLSELYLRLDALCRVLWCMMLAEGDRAFRIPPCTHYYCFSFLHSYSVRVNWPYHIFACLMLHNCSITKKTCSEALQDCG